MIRNFDSEKPIWSQVCEQIRTDIISGVYMPGEKLPGVRDLSASVAVNPNTMQRAFAQLEREGLVETHGTNGRFVCEDTSIIESARESVLRNAAANYLKVCRDYGADAKTAIKILKGAEEN